MVQKNTQDFVFVRIEKCISPIGKCIFPNAKDVSLNCIVHFSNFRTLGGTTASSLSTHPKKYTGFISFAIEPRYLALFLCQFFTDYGGTRISLI